MDRPRSALSTRLVVALAPGVFCLLLAFCTGQAHAYNLLYTGSLQGRLIEWTYETLESRPHP